MERRDRDRPLLLVGRGEEVPGDREYLVELGPRHAMISDIEEPDGPGRLAQLVRNLPTRDLVTPVEGRDIDDGDTLSAH